MAATQSWAQLRQQARQLESQTEKLFSTYAQFGASSNIPAEPSEDERRVESQIEDMFTQRQSVIQSLSRHLDSEAQPSAVKSSHLAQHREQLSNHRADMKRLKSQLGTSRDRANLLSSVRSDISAYHAENANPHDAEAEYMLDERRRIDSSHNMADSVLSQAYAVNESFGMQREQLERIRWRVTNAFGQVPGINSLIGRIGSKKRRDGIILGSFIAFCFLMLLYLM